MKTFVPFVLLLLVYVQTLLRCSVYAQFGPNVVDTNTGKVGSSIVSSPMKNTASILASPFRVM